MRIMDVFGLTEYLTEPITLLVIAIITCVVAFITVYVVTPYLIKYLIGKNSTVPDVHKKEKTRVAYPGGPAVIIGVIASEAVLYGFLQNTAILAIMAVSVLAFLVGLVDDKRAMSGWLKSLALVAAALPIILLGAYETDLAFPLVGNVQIPILYFGIILVIIPITGNTINSIDVLNGVASGFMIIASITLGICLFIIGNYEILLATLPLIFVSLAFYKYHKFPSKIFPGDSGALAFGAMYGAIAIVGQVEVIAAVALLPAIINSFFFLSGVKRIVEYKKIKTKSVILTNDFKLKAVKSAGAITSLVQIIVSKQPMTDRQVIGAIFRLAIFSGILAIITAFLMGVRI